MRSQSAFPFALLAVAVAIAIAGCGDDEESTTTAAASGGALSEDEFVTQANQICAAGDKEIEQAGQELTDSSSQAEIDSFVTDIVLPNIQGQIDAIGALGAPEEIADDVDTFLADAEAALAEAEEDPGLIVAGEDGPFADVNAQADALGLTKCAG